MKFYLIAIAAGLVSGLFQAAVVLPGFGALILAYIAPLPLFLVGLGLGLQGTVVAVIVVGILSFPLAGSTYAIIQVLVYGLPIMILCRQALFSRSNSHSQITWYPGGMLLIWLAGIAMAGLLVAVVGLGIFSDGLMSYADGIIKLFATQLPSLEQREMLLSLVNYLPAFFAVSWILGMLFNGILAQGLLVRFGKNLRPSPILANIELPAVWAGVLAVAVFLATLDGLLGVVGKTLAAIAIVPYFLLGLGVVHGFVQTWKARWIVLLLFYSLMLFWPLPVIIAGVGLVTAMLRLRSATRVVKNGGDAGSEG